MKKLLSVLVIIVGCFIITACNRSQDSLEKKVSSYAQQLIEVKNPYIGDHVADLKVLELLNVAEDYGKYHIELQTDKEPYIIKLNFEEKPEESEGLQDTAFLILSLIENVDEVQWTYPDYQNGEEVLITMYLNTKDAKNILNKDIKVFGESKESIQELLDQLGIH